MRATVPTSESEYSLKLAPLQCDTNNHSKQPTQSTGRLLIVEQASVIGCVLFSCLLNGEKSDDVSHQPILH
jgi:hypothetical protein